MEVHRFLRRTRYSQKIRVLGPLRSLHHRSSLSWLCAGDFNEIVKQAEKSGGRLRPHNQMQQFKEVLDECGFMDLGFKGFPFTWSKHWQNGFSVWERLDRAMASQDWFLEFPGTVVHHIDNTSSDHKMLWVKKTGLEFRQKKKPFRFEEVWLADKGCGEVVEGVWLASVEENNDKTVLRKIETCGKELTRWSKECFGNIRNELTKKRKELARVERQALQGGCAVRLVEIKKEIDSLMDKEERMWRQRSRSLYLKEGDRNTRFFHC